MNETAVLLIDCPDRKGLVPRVSGLLYEKGAEVLSTDFHRDATLGLFFMRMEWGLIQNGSLFDLNGFRRDFAPLAEELGMRWSLTSNASPMRVALFCSQQLHCIGDLLHRLYQGEMRCNIPVIVSNHRLVERLAEFYGIPFAHTPMTERAKKASEEQQLELLQEHKVELVVLARYMQIVPPAFVARYPQKIINVHHSFLPSFTGAKPYHAAFVRGVKLIGATSHYVNDELDTGAIIEQEVERISHRDQVENLVARGRDLERVVLSRALRWHLERRILCYANKTVIFD